MVWFIALVFGLVGKSVALVFKLGINLAQKGILFPALIVCGGGYGAYRLWNDDTLGYKALAVVVGIVTAVIIIAIVVKQHERENPDKQLKWGLLGTLNQPKSYNTKINHAQTPQTLQSPQPHGVIFGRQGRKYITKSEETD